jgi:glycosidase
MKKLFVFFFFGCCTMVTVAQQSNYQCYPTNWWAGMKLNKLQLMIRGEGIGNASAVTISYPGISVGKVNKVENPNYVFLDIVIAASAKPGIAKIKITKGNSPFEIDFEIKAKRTGRGVDFAQAISSGDFIYLIMPDRFSNGDVSNDKIPGMRDQSLNRDSVFSRHGGDLQGISNHLEYLQKMGVTTLWLNPVIENDMPDRTEHGYAFTNHYKIDPRLGGELAYQQLIDAAHERGMKIIQDAVYNHVGLYHFTIQDMPMKDWVHQWPNYTNTNYLDQAVFDPHASEADKKIMTDGWFTKMMPDLNESNPYVANFLIQHAIWTMEQFGIDGWRIDTYAYNDMEFMNNCNRALMNEYPEITLFGETWVHGVPNQSYFVENNYNIPFKSNLRGATDFQTLWGIKDAMTQHVGSASGVSNLYNTLAQDFVYNDPAHNVIFLDNHDMDRFYSVVKEDMDKYKSSLCWLFTCRGIPQMYYGDELATTGVTTPNDGHVRLDFPGGFPGDKENKFELSGRTVKDHEIFVHVFNLANYRKRSTALRSGKMMQYAPKDGLYTYFRYDDKQTVMVVMNTAKTDKTISFSNYAERTEGFTQATDIITNAKTALSDFTLGSYKTVVLELTK